jgi:hypothetical protein
MDNYKLKYIEYKIKYLELKKQLGGESDLLKRLRQERAARTPSEYVSPSESTASDIVKKLRASRSEPQPQQSNDGCESNKITEKDIKEKCSKCLEPDKSEAIRISRSLDPARNNNCSEKAKPRHTECNRLFLQCRHNRQK